MANDTPRRPGGQPGNQNALKHGQRTARAILARKLAWARSKGLAHTMGGLGCFPPGSAPRHRPMRPDQLALLAQHDPELFAALTRYGRPRDVVAGLAALLKREARG